MEVEEAEEAEEAEHLAVRARAHERAPQYQARGVDSRDYQVEGRFLPGSDAPGRALELGARREVASPRTWRSYKRRAGSCRPKSRRRDSRTLERICTL